MIAWTFILLGAGVFCLSISSLFGLIFANSVTDAILGQRFNPNTNLGINTARGWFLLEPTTMDAVISLIGLGIIVSVVSTLLGFVILCVSSRRFG